VNKKALVLGIILAVAIGGGLSYRTYRTASGGPEHAEHQEAGHKEDKADAHDDHKEKKDGHEAHGEEITVKMSAELRKQNGVVAAPAQKQRMAGAISVTGKVEANADRIAHVSPRISGKIVSVRASLGDTVSTGQPLVNLDSVELGEALNRYRQSKTKLALAQSNMERVKALVDKKIAARKDILQTETDYRIALTDLHADEERLMLYGIAVSEIDGDSRRNPLLPVRSPIGGVITEKHAIVGELADPSKRLYTIADLSSICIVVDINEKDLDKIHRGQESAF